MKKKDIDGMAEANKSSLIFLFMFKSGKVLSQVSSGIKFHILKLCLTQTHTSLEAIANHYIAQ